MALAECRECGKQVSTEAVTCPSCGVPSPTRVGSPMSAPDPAPVAPRVATRIPQASSRPVPTVNAKSRDQELQSYVNASLLPGERVLFRGHPHPIFLWSGTIFWLVLTIADFIVFSIVINLAVSLWMILVLPLVVVTVLAGIRALVLSKTSEYALTTQRLIVKRGWLNRQSGEILLGKVESISVAQDLIGRVSGYGTLVVIGTGGSREAFPGVSAPLDFRKRAQAQIALGR